MSCSHSGTGLWNMHTKTTELTSDFLPYVNHYYCEQYLSITSSMSDIIFLFVEKALDSEN